MVVIDERYSGLPGFALGGYIAGLLAATGQGVLEVSLLRPIRIGDQLSPDADKMVLLRNEEAVASAAPAALDLELPPLVSTALAGRATDAYPGRDHHFFPMCYCCGPDRPAGQGLHIFPGPVPGGPGVAALWHPPSNLADATGMLSIEMVWAALDCPGIWGQIVSSTATGDKAVTGRIAVQRIRPVPISEPCVVMGWPVAKRGRSIVVGSALISDEGEILALARQTMVITDRGVPLDREAWLDAPKLRNTATGSEG